AFMPAMEAHRVVIDFGSEASQVGFRHCGPQSAVLYYDILENIMSQLILHNSHRQIRREDFLNNEPGNPHLFRSFYAVSRKMKDADRGNFPFNFTNAWVDDELRLFITRQEVAATETGFRDAYEIIP